jgi:RNA polymerase sigma-70 factor (ECF subfamily)
MTEELLGPGDPVIRRLQQAFAHEEPATDLAAVLQRAAQYQAGDPPAAHDPPSPGQGLTPADLVAARRREPAAVTRIYTAYAPALFRFFMAAVSDRHQAEDLTGTAFVSAIEGLPRFRGPVEALGGWLFQIARHDLYDYHRRQTRSRVEPLEDDVGEAAAAASAPGLLDPELGAETTLEAASFALRHRWTTDPEAIDALGMGHLDDAQVAAALQQLPPDQREVLLLTMVAGLTAPEVATALGKTVGQVKALRHRGLAALAGVLDVTELVLKRPEQH